MSRLPCGSIRRPGPSPTNPIRFRRRRGTRCSCASTAGAARSSPSWSRSPPSRASARSCGGRITRTSRPAAGASSRWSSRRRPRPSRIKPENAGGLVPPNQDKEVFNRIAPGAVPIQPEKLLPAATTPKLPANGLPAPAAPKPAEAEATKAPTPPLRPPPATPAAGQTPTRRAPRRRPPRSTPTDQGAGAQPAEAGPSIASLIDNMSGPTGGWRCRSLR